MSGFEKLRMNWQKRLRRWEFELHFWSMSGWRWFYEIYHQPGVWYVYHFEDVQQWGGCSILWMDPVGAVEDTLSTVEDVQCCWGLPSVLWTQYCGRRDTICAEWYPLWSEHQPMHWRIPQNTECPSPEHWWYPPQYWWHPLQYWTPSNVLMVCTNYKYKLWYPSSVMKSPSSALHWHSSGWKPHRNEVA